FIGGKMLVEPWFHISTGQSLMIVGTVIAIAVIVSLVTAKPGKDSHSDSKSSPKTDSPKPMTNPTTNYILQLADAEPRQRLAAATYLFSDGTARIAAWLDHLQKDEEFRSLVVSERHEKPSGDGLPVPKLTVGIAVNPDTFEKIRTANGSPA